MLVCKSFSCQAHGGNVVGVAMVVDRSNGALDFGVPFESLISLQVETFEADKLPPDLAKIPVVKPGSKQFFECASWHKDCATESQVAQFFIRPT